MDEEVRSYRDLIVWQRGMALASACYRKTRSFPRDEIYGLTSQIRRAATSIPTNIAEGNGRENTGTYVNFLRVAQGSLEELETLMLIAQDAEIMSATEASELLESCEAVGKPLRGLIRSMQRRVAEP